MTAAIGPKGATMQVEYYGKSGPHRGWYFRLEGVDIFDPICGPYKSEQEARSHRQDHPITTAQIGPKAATRYLASVNIRQREARWKVVQLVWLGLALALWVAMLVKLSE